MFKMNCVRRSLPWKINVERGREGLEDAGDGERGNGWQSFIYGMGGGTGSEDINDRSELIREVRRKVESARVGRSEILPHLHLATPPPQHSFSLMRGNLAPNPA